jgi:hypothetical protein
MLWFSNELMVFTNLLIKEREREKWRIIGLACSRLFVLEEIKEVFKVLFTTGNQFGLETNESTTKMLIEANKRRQ